LEAKIKKLSMSCWKKKVKPNTHARRGDDTRMRVTPLTLQRDEFAAPRRVPLSGRRLKRDVSRTGQYWQRAFQKLEKHANTRGEV
jgi:hypothetical protein